MRHRRLILLVICLTLLNGCATNPVTGKREFTLVPEDQELQIGEEHYLPSRQMQGGDYVADPELTAYVSQVGQRLAAVSDRELPYEFIVLNNSIPNAWALPGGKIAINRGLLIQLANEAELAAVLGHEIVHAAARHSAKGIERGMLLQGATAAIGMAGSKSDYGAAIVGSAQVGAALLSHKYGRDAESESDYYGMRYMSRAGYDPQAAVSLQELFVKLSAGQKGDWLSGLFASHPPSQERVDANKHTASQLPAGGELGVDRYQRQITRLRANQPAYAAHDQGRLALQQGDYPQAMGLVQRAIELQPAEAIFYALQGDIHFAQQNYQEARLQYDQAVARNSNYFYPFLQRGLAREALSDLKGAKGDLNRSIELLPTATAYNALGNIAQRQGDLAAAVQYYRQAAGSDSEAGRQALGSLAKLDLKDHPGDYLELIANLDENQNLIIGVHNFTPLSIGAVTVQIEYRDHRGKNQRINKVLAGPIQPGKQAQLPTGIGSLTDPGRLSNISAKITYAEIME